MQPALEEKSCARPKRKEPTRSEEEDFFRANGQDCRASTNQSPLLFPPASESAEPEFRPHCLERAPALPPNSGPGARLNVRLPSPGLLPFFASLQPDRCDSGGVFCSHWIGVQFCTHTVQTAKGAASPPFGASTNMPLTCESVLGSDQEAGIDGANIRFRTTLTSRRPWGR